MRKAYQYLFYRAYDLIGLTGDYDLAWGASHFLALSLGILVLRMLYLFGNYLNALSMGIFGVSAFLILHIINYLLFLREDRYKAVIEYYGSEPVRYKKIGRTIFVIALVVLVYSLF